MDHSVVNVRYKVDDVEAPVAGTRGISASRSSQGAGDELPVAYDLEDDSAGPLAFGEVALAALPSRASLPVFVNFQR
jgi:hypothetical protein